MDDLKFTSHRLTKCAYHIGSAVQDNWPLPFSDLDPLDTGFIPYYLTSYELSVAIYIKSERSKKDRITVKPE